MHMSKRMNRIGTILLVLFLLSPLTAVSPLAAGAAGDFDVRDGVLIKYSGQGGDVVIPAGVTSIGDNAFYYGSKITSVTIPAGVTSIGNNAFSLCYAMTSVTIPSGVTRIGESAFASCAALTSVRIPDGVTRIEAHTFSGCSELRNLVLPNSVTQIGEGAFVHCVLLNSLTIPDGVTVIGDMAFAECESLTQVVIPDGVTRIEDSAFYACKALTSVSIGNAVTYMGHWAFAFTGLLNSVSIPESVTLIDGNPFHHPDRETFTVYGKAGTAAERFAAAYGYTFNGQAQTKYRSDLPNAATPGLLVTDTASVTDAELYRQTLRAMPTDRAVVEYYYLHPATAADENVMHSDDPKIVAMAAKICSGLTDDFQKAEAVYNWVAKNIVYDTALLDAGGVSFSIAADALYALEKRRAVCEGYSLLTAALLRASGIPALRVCGATVDSVHAWNEAFVNGKWILLDSTWGAPSGIKDFFNPSVDVFSQSHLISSYFYGDTVRAFTIIDNGTLMYAALPHGGGVFEIPSGVREIGNGRYPMIVGMGSFAMSSEAAAGGGRADSVTIPEGVVAINAAAFQDFTDMKSIRIPASVTRIEGGSFYGCALLRDVSIAGQRVSIDASAFTGAGALTIHGTPGSEVEAFALKYGYAFADISDAPLSTTIAKYSVSKIYVNGSLISFDAYNIGGNNYFKLRDLAFFLNQHGKRFEVTWDGANNTIALTSGSPYTSVGGEMEGARVNRDDKTPAPTTAKVYLDGAEVHFTAYNIEGNNYFKLRDVGQTLDFGVDWDSGSNAVIIDTGKGYTPE